jgi:tyrosine-specific transport protein
MLISYLLLCGSAVTTVKSALLFEKVSFAASIWGAPVLFGAFGYHNVVPTLSDYLNRDRKALLWSLGLGTAAAALIYLIWQFLVLGSVSERALLEALNAGDPAVVALQKASNHPHLYLFGRWFGALALLTSLLGVSLSIVDFFKDVFTHFSWKNSRALFCLCTFLPPLGFSIYHPHLFMTALGIAGGIGESLLNAILPIGAVWISRYVMQQDDHQTPLGKKALLFLLLLSTLVIGIEILHLMK